MAAQGHYFRLYEAQARRTEADGEDGDSEHDQNLLAHQLPQPSAHGAAVS
jgi:ATP-binding cassette subfamily B protein